MTQSDKSRPIVNAPISDAAVTATGADIDNDHADERPINRSDDAPDDNSEQIDEPAQAQTVADEALRGTGAGKAPKTASMAALPIQLKSMPMMRRMWSII
jgi:hypothetical protein